MAAKTGDISPWSSSGVTEPKCF